MRGPLVDYLTFSRKERIGIVVIMSFIVITAVAPMLFTVSNSDLDSTRINDLRDRVIMLERGIGDSLQGDIKRGRYPVAYRQFIDGDSSGLHSSGENRFNRSNSFSAMSHSERERRNNLTRTLFYFDPNTLDIAGWQKLGVREKTAVTIQKYLGRGGRFRRADDLLKIYGLSDDDKKQLLPFVRIQASEANPPGPEPPGYIVSPNRTPFAAGNVQNSTSGYVPRKQLHTIDINTADTSEWASLPGIGAVLSLRIVRYRERLGGYYDVLQVGETYGLHDSVFQKMKPYLTCKGGIKQIPLNEVTPDILERHPYLKRQIARAIIDYRAQHGAFKEIGDLKQVIAITPELFERIAPYLRL